LNFPRRHFNTIFTIAPSGPLFREFHDWICGLKKTITQFITYNPGMGNRLSKIYTHTGDKGTTGLGYGPRDIKSDGQPTGQRIAWPMVYFFWIASRRYWRTTKCLSTQPPV